jgi:hypothetical protein
MNEDHIALNVVFHDKLAREKEFLSILKSNFILLLIVVVVVFVAILQHHRRNLIIPHNDDRYLRYVL